MNSKLMKYGGAFAMSLSMMTSEVNSVNL
jgi:hypothetical protein